MKRLICAVVIGMIAGGLLGGVAAAGQRPAQAAPKKSLNSPEVAAAFERLRAEGNDALYNLDYATAHERYKAMARLVDDHPSPFVYLANNLWLETLNSSRRLSTSVYMNLSFYDQGGEEDKIDPKREATFYSYVRQALEICKLRLKANPNDAEALYYKGSAIGLRSGFNATVKRSFTRAISDANESVEIQKSVIKLDPGFVDAYMSIGLYEYVIDSLPWVWRALTKLAGLSGSKERGLDYLERVAANGRFANDDARVLLMGLYAREKKPEKSLALIGYLAQKYPRNYLFGVERAGMLYRMGREAEGAGAFGELLKDGATAAAAGDLINYQWGEALSERGRFAEALARYELVKRGTKQDTEIVSLAHLRAGQMLDVLGRRAAAEAEYEQVLKLENVFDSHKKAAEFKKKPYVPSKA